MMTRMVISSRSRISSHISSASAGRMTNAIFETLPEGALDSMIVLIAYMTPFTRVVVGLSATARVLPLSVESGRELSPAASLPDWCLRIRSATPIAVYPSLYYLWTVLSCDTPNAAHPNAEYDDRIKRVTGSYDHATVFPHEFRLVRQFCEWGCD